MSKNCVFTVCIGDEFKKFSIYTLPTIEKYAKKIGSAFFVLDKPYLDGLDFKWSKFYINELLKKYDRVLFLDSDILVNPESPNIFEETPENLLGMCADPEVYARPFISSKFKSYVERYNVAYNKKIDYKRATHHFNSGVVLCNIETNPFIFPESMEFKISSEPIKDQNYINVVIIEKNIKTYILEEKWNFLIALSNIKTYNVFHNYFTHYASKKCKKYISKDYLKLFPKD